MTTPTSRNRLTKEKIYTKGQAGQAYRAPKPARTVMETRTVCAYRLQQGAPQGEYVLVPADPSVGRFEDEYVWVTTSPGVVEYVYSCRQEQVSVYYPADPGQAYIPAIAPSMDYQLGWNAGARSLLPITNHGQATFQAGASNIGAVCGLNTYEDPLRHNGGSTRFAWHVARGTAKVMERGNVRTATFAHTDDTVFKVRRLGEKITYWMDDELVYTSTEASTGPLWLQASLYSGDDYLFNPKIEALGLAPIPDADPVSGSLSIALPSASTFFAAGATARLRLALAAPAPTLGLRGGQGVLRLHLPELSMHASDGFSARLRLTLPQATLAAGAPAVAVPTYAVLKLVLMPAIHDAYGLVGATGQLNMGLPPPEASLSDKQLGRLSLALPPQLLRGRSWPADELPIDSSPLWLVGISSPSGVSVLSTEPMTVAALGSVTSYAEVTLSAAKMKLQVGGSLDVLSEVILATVPMTLIAGGRIGVLNELNEVFVLAMTSEEPGGTTQYENYPFNSFARIGGRNYGANVDGLYLLEGDDDAGQPIDASFGFGQLDFGKANIKTVPHCYLGAAAGGMRLEVQALLNGAPTTYSYVARGHGASLRGVRFDLGRGLRSTYVMPTFYNVDGAAFEVDAVRFMVADSARRI